MGGLPIESIFKFLIPTIPSIVDDRMKKKLTVILALIGISLLLGVGGYIWIHRMELIIAPRAWKEVVQTYERKEKITPSVKEFLELCHPQIKFARAQQLQTLRSREGNRIWLLCYKAENKGRIMRNGYSLSPFWDIDDEQHLLIDDNGQLLPTELSFFSQHISDIQHRVEKGKYFDKIVVFDPRPSFLDYELSVDRKGFVPHGYYGIHSNRTYYSWTPFKKKELDLSLVDLFMSSADPADHLRALHLVEHSGQDYPQARSLYKSPSLVVRKKAFAVLGAQDTDIVNLRSYVEDPHPDIRLSVLYPLSQAEESDKYLKPFTKDSDPEIREVAHWFQSYSFDLSIARRSALYLLKNKSDLCVSTHVHQSGHGLYLQQVSSNEIVDEVLKIIEEDIDRIYKNDNQFVLGEYLELELNQLKVEHLSLYIPRLIAIYNQLTPRIKKEEYWKLKGIIMALMAQEKDECDQLIAPRIRFDLEDSVSYQGYFEGLVKRTKPVKELIPDLWKLDQKWERESKEEDLSFGGEYLVSPSLWFLAKWNVGKSRLLLIKRLKERTNRLILDPDLLDSFVDEKFQKELEAHGISFNESSNISF